MGCKKQGAKNRVNVIQKEKRSGCLFSFWITMTLLFAPCFLQPIFLDLFFKFQNLKNIRSAWYFKIVGADWLGEYDLLFGNKISATVLISTKKLKIKKADD